ncbi:hypothetical protein GK047_16085 [Paenibacillus sp. SYP-B3998]|uniref:Uncharacterized protein n=1 Tax=Paenibacillus sp. SYP-B3998 TaxID=2678564 RepID=A0A6G3ZZ80_9BACL|nr:hypothetical protein [Paenibacillus sp. SYP-B3998]NEW07526.1 hypothetical protein [Paenibacillus sp. SYP-B3998]
MSVKLVKKPRAVVRKLKATAKGANATESLGGGFSRFVFNRTIGPNTFFTFTFLGGSLKPVSGGWFIGRQNSLPAYATSSYSQNATTWIITVFNPTNVTRPISFTFIAKS